MELVTTISGPVIGAAIALFGIFINQRMNWSTQERTRYRNEIRDLAGALLTSSEKLWVRGWEMHHAHWDFFRALEPHGPDTVAAQKAEVERVATMDRAGVAHGEVLSIQRRLMLASPALDQAASELIEAS
ncbi:hypothetical protein K0651_13085 [Ornithinimicrobium sp. Arc0846-15]|nr:hypothetical protein [Ornithinimicrobium laminariae]